MMRSEETHSLAAVGGGRVTASAALGQARIMAVLFDLDGTVIDSEPAYWESDRVFLGSWGICYDVELNAAMVGRGIREFFRELELRFPDSPLHALPMAERARLKDEAYLTYASGRIAAFPGVAAFARLLAKLGVPAAIASGSSPHVIDATLEMVGLLECFPVRVSASEVQSGKPEPDVFLEAARRLQIAPELCLVLEDSRPGIQAARAARMACVALPHPDHAGREGFSLADMVVDGGAAHFDGATVLERWSIGGADRRA